MLKSEKYKQDLEDITRKIKNLETLKFNLEQKLQKLEKFPEFDSELQPKKKKEENKEEEA